MKKLYSGIDIIKFFFACLIPLLHIPFEENLVIDVLRQYVSRLGVPFFFAVSGFFLSRSMETRGKMDALLRYEKRVGKLLLIWLAIYSPILYVFMAGTANPVWELLFKTPAYLWYLTAILVGAIPFCLVQNRKLLWGLSSGLYLFGTLMGESYDWLTGGIPAYTSVFLTTRNGLFFALPLMCVGELSGHISLTSLKKQLIPLLLAAVALFVEITFVGRNASAGADRSMYLLLPVLTYFLLRASMHISIEADTRFLRGASVAVYVMQFGFITVLGKVAEVFGLSMTVWGWVTYSTVIIGGCFCYWVCRKNKFLKHLF